MSGKGAILALALALALAWLAGPFALAEKPELAEAIATLKAVGPEGQGNRAASLAWPKVAAVGADQLTTVLAGMDGAGPLASNWFRAAVEAIAERELAARGTLPTPALEKFLFQTEHSPRGRRLAYEWIVRVDPAAPDRLMPKMLDDPSVELRREAVQRVLDAAEKAEGKEQAKLYQQALAHARDLDQVKTCTEALKKLDLPVDTATHLGFVTTWHLVGPFDNTDKQGFDVAYPPEEKFDLAASYQGKLGEVRWFSYTTDDPYGIVDLAKALDKHKGAIVYAATEFVLDEPREVQLRLGSINANKAWVNGALLTANEVYHAGMQIDQYNSSVKLKAGKNLILLKICQNEQTEDWAQRWQFQLRVTDELGGAILSRDRPITGKAASRPAGAVR